MDAWYAANMAMACAPAYAIITALLVPFGETRVKAWRARMDRLIATSVSVALCFLYVLIFRSRAWKCGSDRTRNASQDPAWPTDIVITGITTEVVFVVAGIGPENTWQRPILRLVGIGRRRLQAGRLLSVFLSHRRSGPMRARSLRRRAYAKSRHPCTGVLAGRARPDMFAGLS